MNEDDLWRDLGRDLVHYAAALVGPDEAEDVVSAVFLRVMEADRFRRLENPRPYLFKSVLNECRTRSRSRSRVVPLARVEAIAVDSDQDPEILAAVLELPVRQRAATFLVYWMGLTIAETAEMMGVGVGTIKRYLYLARRTLARSLHSGAWERSH